MSLAVIAYDPFAVLVVSPSGRVPLIASMMSKANCPGERGMDGAGSTVCRYSADGLSVEAINSRIGHPVALDFGTQRKKPNQADS